MVKKPKLTAPKRRIPRVQTKKSKKTKQQPNYGFHYYTTFNFSNYSSNITVNPPICGKCRSCQHKTFNCPRKKKVVECVHCGGNHYRCPFHIYKSTKTRDEGWERPGDWVQGKRIR